MHDLPASEPLTLVAGMSWAWARTLPEFPPADGWALKYALRGPTDLDIEAEVEEGAYVVRVPVSKTEGVQGGTYRLYGYVEREGERQAVCDDEVAVEANPLAEVGRASHAETVLAAIEAAIEGRMTSDQEEATINGRSIKRIPIAELVRLRGIYAARVARSRAGGRFGRRVEVTFVRPR